MGLKIPRVQTCCCGCTLETGSSIIGWLSVVSGILLIGASVFTLVSGPDGSHHATPSVANSVMEIISGIVSIIIAVCLLVGVSKRSHGLLRFWVWITCIGMIFFFINYLITIISAISIGFIGIALTTFIFVLVSCGLTFYFVCVVNSLYHEVLAEKQPNVA